MLAHVEEMAKDVGQLRREHPDDFRIERLAVRVESLHVMACKSAADHMRDGKTSEQAFAIITSDQARLARMLGA